MPLATAKAVSQRLDHGIISLKVEMIDGCCRMLSSIFERFIEASPVTVMLRATLEQIFSAEKLDESTP